MYRRLLISAFNVTLLGLISANTLAQSTNVPLNKGYYHLLDRYQIMQGKFASGYHSSMKPYPRQSITALVDTAENLNLSTVDQFNLSYLKNDNWEWFDSVDNESEVPVLKQFYRVKSDLYHVRQEDFDLHLNPVFYWSAGEGSNDDRTAYINTRGVELRGMIDGKVGFYSFLGENQARFPKYVREWVNDRNVVPHEGFWKDFGEEGVDFFTPRGYISFNATRHINFQFGHDQFFIGNGYRSLILSSFAPPALFLKLNTKVWRINYTNLFTQMKADAFGTSGGSLANERFPEKYVTMHHLSINITDKINLGLFEAIAFGREDSTGSDDFDFNYLNPIIFYRAIEQQNGSVDNALVGMDFQVLPLKNFSIYGQFVLDELVVDEFFSDSGWWGNKYGVQVGGHYINVFNISNLDLQLEYNTVRPYTYSHRSIFTNYAHYRQPLAHPLGANFREWLAIIRYQPLERLFLTGKAFFASYGADSLNANYGGNILIDDRTRIMDFNNETGQGVGTNLLFLNLVASYMFKHNLYIDGSLIYRELDSDISSRNASTTFVSLSLRLNIPRRNHEF